MKDQSRNNSVPRGGAYFHKIEALALHPIPKHVLEIFHEINQFSSDV